MSLASPQVTKPPCHHQIFHLWESRDQKDEVSDNCASEIFRRQEDAADDFRLDKELYEACQVRTHVALSLAALGKPREVQLHSKA